MGATTVIVLPVCVGCVLAYGFPTRWAFNAYLGTIVIGSVVSMVASGDGIGLFCGCILGGIGIPLYAVGVLMGLALRQHLKNSGYSHGPFLPALLLAAVTGLGTLGQAAFLPPAEEETVVTTGRVEAPPNAVWSARVFDGGARTAPPPLAAIGLPTPRGNDGALTRPGDVKTCRLGRGVVRLLVTESRAPETLAFTVIEQRDFENRSVRLMRGSVVLAAAGNGSTDVTISTTYAPLLRDRTLWRPIERLIACQLHEHVLRELRAAVVAAPGQADETSSTSRGQFQRTGTVSPAPRETRSVESPSENRRPFQR